MTAICLAGAEILAVLDAVLVAGRLAIPLCLPASFQSKSCLDGLRPLR